MLSMNNGKRFDTPHSSFTPTHALILRKIRASVFSLHFFPTLFPFSFLFVLSTLYLSLSCRPSVCLVRLFLRNDIDCLLTHPYAFLFLCIAQNPFPSHNAAPIRFSLIMRTSVQPWPLVPAPISFCLIVSVQSIFLFLITPIVQPLVSGVTSGLPVSIFFIRYWGNRAQTNTQANQTKQ